MAPAEQVEGAWTIQLCGGCGRAAMGRSDREWCPDTGDDEKVEQRSVPVVPCDEAAIDRAARAMAERDHRRAMRTGVPLLEATWQRIAPAYRTQAREALVAAGRLP